MNPKLIRITTVPISLKILLKGQLAYMRENGFEVIAVASPGEDLEEVKKREGVRTVAVEMTRTISPFKDLKALFELVKLFRKEKPQIVHTHTPKAGLLGMMAAKITGVPHRLHTVAGMPLTVATGAKRQLLNQVEKLTYACATRVYPNSFGLEKFILEEKFTSPQKLKVIGKGSSNGIDTNYFDPQLVSDDTQSTLRKELGLGENDFVFVFVGRIVKDKGINELVQAFTNLKLETSKNSSLLGREIESETKLLLVGPLESELDPLIPETIRAIETNPNIISAGFQKDVRPYFAIANALVFPSYREGFPNVVMQAGAMGLPSIVSNINGCNEIIIEGKNGMIIPVKDAKALENAMTKLESDKDLYANLKINSRPFITSRFEQKRIWDELKSEYQHLLQHLD